MQKNKKVGDQLYLPLPTKEHEEMTDATATNNASSSTKAPLVTYFALSTIRAIDLGLTNLSMKYLNYPAKTLIKSSRVIFTMLIGVFFAKKKYKRSDYAMVFMLVVGLGLFLRAGMSTHAKFHPYGVAMLVSTM